MSEGFINQKFGKYVIQGQLGEGGMGAVLRSEHPQLNIPVAIKVILGTANDEARQRFMREAQLAARLSHPNIVRIFDVDEHDSMPYLVMELIDGESLLDRLQKIGRSSIDQVLELGIQLADALGYAHSHNMLHRDLKPANILIRANGTPVIVDFGLARLTDDSSGLTQSGMIVGTLAYMAPEQLQAQPLDARTDIYALGVVFFQMLTGKMPFEGDTAQVMFGHVYTPPPPPSSLGVQLPPALDSLVVAMMAKAPANRPQTMADVATTLRAIKQNPATAPRYSAYVGPTQQQQFQGPPQQQFQGPPQQFQGPPHQQSQGSTRPQGQPGANPGMPPQSHPSMPQQYVGMQQQQYAPQQQQFASQQPFQANPPSYPGGPPSYPPHAGVAPKKGSTGKLIAIIGGGVLALVLAVFVIMSFTNGDNDPKPTQTALQDPTPRPTKDDPAPTEDDPAPTEDDPAPTSESGSSIEPGETVEVGGSANANPDLNVDGITFIAPTADEISVGDFEMSGVRFSEGFADTYFVYGIIKNTGSEDRGSIEIKLLLFDGENQEIGNAQTYLSYGYLAPNEEIGWSILVDGLPEGAEIKGYTLEVYSNQASFEKDYYSRNLSVSDLKTEGSSFGSSIDGKITNTGSTTISLPAIYMTLLDSDGRVLDTIYAFGDKNELKPDETTRFDTSSLSINDPNEVDRWFFMVQGSKP